MEVIGYVSTEVVSLLGLNILPGTPIYLGTSNISHMEKAHPSDYSKMCIRDSDMAFAPLRRERREI